MHLKDITWCQWDRYRGVWMLSLCGDVLGSVLPHTLDIKNGLLLTEGGASLQLHRRNYALSGRAFTVGHCSVPPYSEAFLHGTVRTTGGRTSGGPHRFFCRKHWPRRRQNPGRPLHHHSATKKGVPGYNSPGTSKPQKLINEATPHKKVTRRKHQTIRLTPPPTHPPHVGRSTPPP